MAYLKHLLKAHHLVSVQKLSALIIIIIIINKNLNDVLGVHKAIDIITN